MVKEMNWDRKENYFGYVPFNSTHKTVFKFIGEGALPLRFSGSCGCTQMTWNPKSKELIVHLHMNSMGKKNATINVIYGNGDIELLTLKAEVK